MKVKNKNMTLSKQCFNADRAPEGEYSSTIT